MRVLHNGLQVGYKCTLMALAIGILNEIFPLHSGTQNY